MPYSQSDPPLEEERKIIHLQENILRIALGHGNANDVVDRICQLTEPLLPESVATVLLLNGDGRLDVFAAPNVPEEARSRLSGLQPGPESGSCGNAVMRQEPVFVVDTLRDNRWRQLRPLAVDFGIMACWSIPIRDSQDKVIGSFALSSFVHRSPSSFHMRVMETVASAISLVLEHHHIQEWAQTQSRALQAISEGVLITGSNEKVLFVNSAFTRITGYTLDEMRGQNCAILQGDNTNADTKASIRAALSHGEEFHGEILNYKKDGRPFWNHLSIAPVRDEHGKITHYVSVQRDITDFKKQEAYLRIAAQVFDVDEGIIIADSERRILHVNQAFCRLTGYTPEEVIGKTPSILSSGRHDRAFYDSMWESIREQGSWRGEIWNRRKNGEIYPELLTITAIHDSAGTVQNYVAHFQDITERLAQEEYLRHLALHDSLTNLFNRYALDQEIERAIPRAERLEKLLVLCVMDLDGFKPVNDTYGHEAGDEVLTTIGKRLSEILRRTDSAYRLGGDEFVVLLEYLERLDDLDPLLKKIDGSVRAPIRLRSGETISVGVSIGVAIYFPDGSGDAEAGDSLLRLADQALYESKAHKSDREHPWVLFGEERKTPRTPAQRLLDAGALEVWYQPILDNRARRVVGVEALARLRDGDGKIWSPAEFLPQLQGKDLSELSRQVLQQALIDLSVLDALGLSLWVSVNIDPHSVSDACVAYLREMIVHGAVDPSRITLEILEGSDFLEKQTALEHLLALKAQGIRLALDDVGSAYASLLRMKDLPIDKIKLDQGFVRTLEERPQDLHFVESIQDLAAGMGVDLVVEGVETDDILDAVTVLGVKFLQGYGIARPMPLAQLQEFLAHQPSLHRQHPTGLLGLYAAQLANHSSLKKAIRQNPRLVDYRTLVDATACPIHDDLRRLGLDDGGPLDRLHQE
ncbi:MAG: EAL domain-containing protein, partial [Acidithiobacillus sp.]